MVKEKEGKKKHIKYDEKEKKHIKYDEKVQVQEKREKERKADKINIHTTRNLKETGKWGTHNENQSSLYTRMISDVNFIDLITPRYHYFSINYKLGSEF